MLAGMEQALVESPAAGAGAPAGIELRHLRYLVALAGAITLEELAGLQVIHGPLIVRALAAALLSIPPNL